jgi:hypothetical protein
MTGVVVRGGRKKPDVGSVNYGQQFFSQLTLVPRAFPLAPECDEFSAEIRQMIMGRYRVLFTIKRRRVHVLHVRGSFVGDHPEID